MSKRCWQLLLSLIILSLATTTIGSAQQLTPVSIQLGSIPGASWAPIYLAKSEGLFAKEGLDVTVVPGKTSQDAVNAVATGQVTMGLALAVSQIINADKGQKLVAVGSFFGRNIYGVVAGNDTGIKTLKDLAGKKVLTTGALFEQLLKGLIKKAGGDPEATTYILIANPAGLIGAYVGKQADAMETVLPFAEEALGNARPSRYIAFSSSGDSEPGYAFVVKPETLATQKPMIAKFLRAVYAAQEIANNDRAKMLSAALATVPDSTPASEVPSYAAFRKFQCDDSQNGKPFAAFIPANWAAATELYLQVGAIDHPVDPKSLYTNEFALGPNAVSKLKCPQ